MTWVTPVLEELPEQPAGGPLQANLPDESDHKGCQGNRETDDDDGGQQTHLLSCEETHSKQLGTCSIRFWRESTRDLARPTAIASDERFSHQRGTLIGGQEPEMRARPEFSNRFENSRQVIIHLVRDGQRRPPRSKEHWIEKRVLSCNRVAADTMGRSAVKMTAKRAVKVAFQTC
jgi:hypothetical protein